MSHPAVSAGKVASSAMWRATETAGTEAISFIVFATLARLLSLEDFGLLALAGSIMQLLQALLYHGFTEALIQRPEISEEHHRTVLAANFVLALVLVAVGMAAAWPIGWLLGRAEFATIFMALLPSLLFRGLSSPMLASLRRDMDFRSIAIRTLFGVIAGGMVAIFMARHGFGFWALVVQQWSNEVVGFLVLLRASPIKPWNLRWSRKAMRELLPVALPVMGTAFLSVASRRLDTLALGLFQSNSTVGIYYMANRLVFAAQMVTQHGLSEVAMVVLSSMNRDAARYRRGLLRALRLMSYLCASAFGLLAVAGPWLAPIVFGAAWGPAAQPLRVLAALSVGGAVVSIAGVTLVASGYAAAYSRLATGAAFAQLAAVVLAARWGLMAVVWAVGIVQCAAMLPALRMLTQHYKLTAKSLFGELAPILGLFAIGLATAHWVTSLTSGWFAQPSGSIAFILLMGTGAFPLLRKERRERAEREREALLTN